MARAPLLQLSDVSLGFGGTALFADLSLSVQEGDRLALVGRNGSGKSTLMKLMAGLVEPDAGSCTPGPGITVGYMEQDPDLSDYATLGAFAAAGLPEGEEWRIAREAEGLGFDPDMPAATASGGERRRAALARLLAQAPELMLLDEPTNHLDIAAIGWLERRLADSKTAFVVISHDRAFLNALARGLLWLDRGMVRRLDEGFSAFEDWRERIWAEEDAARHKLDRRIKAEGRWAVEGISARRKRNQGRLRALQAMRAERAAQVRRQGRAAMALEAGQTSGRLVIEAKGLSRAYGDTVIVKDLDLRLMRGDRLALVGPNGVGKTSLLRLLTGQEAPDAGRVRHGTALAMAVFDQNRAALDPDASLWDSLTGDPEMRVQGTHDQVMVRGSPRHVVGYLKDFLFDEAQARQPVRALSGGEKARLLLARIMARESNLLVLDEPTNDLDIETLDLLEDLIGDYAGTVLLVSHDRDFIDRVATQTLVMSGGGRIVVHAGGYSDWRAELGESEDTSKSRPSEVKPKSGKRDGKARPTPARAGLSFAERNRLETLPAEIERIEAELARLAEMLADPDLYARDPKRFARATEAVTARQTALAAAEAEWLDLAERAEG